MSRRSPGSRGPIQAPLALTLLLAVGASACQAQGTTPVRREAAAPVILTTPDRLATPGLARPPTPALPELGAGAAAIPDRALDVLGSYVQLEMPRDLGDGSYSRPKLRFGMQSEALKSWATSVGLRADRCTLPTVRGRSRVSSEEVNGTVILLARCTFY